MNAKGGIGGNHGWAPYVYLCTLTERKGEVQVGRAILWKNYWLRAGSVSDGRVIKQKN